MLKASEVMLQQYNKVLGITAQETIILFYYQLND